MKTYTELKQESAAQLSRAQRYERALVDVGNYEQAVTVVGAKIAKYRTQVDLLTKMSEMAGGIDGSIQGKGSFILRDIIIAGCSVGIESQQQHLDLCTRTRKQATEKLTEAKAALEEFV